MLQVSREVRKNVSTFYLRQFLNEPRCYSHMSSKGFGLAFAKSPKNVHFPPMEMLEFSHNTILVIMSCVMAIVAGFTGLSLTRNMAEKTASQRKIAISLAAIALGGGIWSMHFVAMLGLRLPIPYYYDAAITLASALSAILIVGCALILLHFVERRTSVILLAGAIIGLGVLVMHYVGMAGLQLCRAVYTWAGIGLSSCVAILLCMLAVWVAYQRRTNLHILLAAVCFGLAVSSVHFLAMAGTNFTAVPQPGDFGPALSNETLAIGVMLSGFVIFGAFLWVSTTYLDATTQQSLPVDEGVVETPPPAEAVLQIPCEREGAKVYIAPRDVAFVRADGHYTQVYTPKDRLFCVWTITEATKRLLKAGFVQTHRSYLVNPGMVTRFERTKDKGRCTFDEAGLPPVPVSRSKLKDIETVLSGQVGATGAA